MPQEDPATRADETDDPEAASGSPLIEAAGGDSPPDVAAAPGAVPPGGDRPEPALVDLKVPLLVLLVPIGLLMLGSWLFPALVYDGFVAKYYWDPIVNDEGFNPINTISWAFLMGALLFLLWRIVQRIEQPVTFTLIAAVLPYMAAGSITRVLEDTGYFVAPLRYLFITPIIYVLITLVAVLWILIGHMLQRHSRDVGALNSVYALGAFFAVIWVAFAVWSVYGDALAEFGNPIVLLVAMAVPLVYFYNHTKQTGRFSQAGVMATFGMAYLFYAIYLIVLWHTGQQWESVAADKFIPPSAGTEMRPYVYIVMVAVPALITAAVYAYARSRHLNKGSDVALVYMAPLNLLLVFAQMMDATMTSIGIDVYDYREKHFVPDLLIRFVQGTPLEAYAATIVMMPIKFAVALLVIWAIDIYAREDVQQYPDLVALAKMAIIMVGFAPGVRNTVRLAMDV